MPLLSASTDTFVLASTLILAIFVHRKSGSDGARSRFRSATTTFVILHSLYILYTLSFFQPLNLFSRLHIPLSTPSERIRPLVLKRMGSRDGRLPDNLEELLTRLSSFDVRGYYVRFGQSVVQNCDHCHTFGEYALYAFPSIVLVYLRQAAIIGLITIRGTRRERWRTHGIALLAFGGITEVYCILSARIQITGQENSQETIMWHDTLWNMRYLLFLFLPLTIHFLCPESSSISPLAMVPMTNLALQSLHNRMQLLKYTSEATLRVPALRQVAGEFWDTQRIEGKWAREDESVNRTAEFAGVALQRERAHQLVAELQRGFEPDVFLTEVR